MDLNIQVNEKFVLTLSLLFLPILAHADGVFPLWFTFLSGTFVFGIGCLVVIGFIYFLKKFVEIRREEIGKEKELKKDGNEES